MPSTEAIDLDGYTTILTAHESDYRASRGADRQRIVQGIIKEMINQGGEAFNKAGVKGLGKVSQLSKPTILRPHLLGLRG